MVSADVKAYDTCLSSLLTGTHHVTQIGHIKDIGHDPSLPTTRLYATHEAQPYHNDSSDIVGASLTLPVDMHLCDFQTYRMGSASALVSPSPAMSGSLDDRTQLQYGTELDPSQAHERLGADQKTLPPSQGCCAWRKRRRVA